MTTSDREILNALEDIHFLLAPTDLSLGTRIKWTRLFRHLTQKELGILCGFTDDTASLRIRQYELGIRTPKLDILAKIAESLNVSLEMLSDYGVSLESDIMRTLLWGDLFQSLKPYARCENLPKEYIGSYNQLPVPDNTVAPGVTFWICNDQIEYWYKIKKEYTSSGDHDKYVDWVLHWTYDTSLQ